MPLNIYAKTLMSMDNLDRLLDALDRPETYSDAELEQLLASADFKLVHAMRASLQPASDPDVEAEWASFMLANAPRRRPVWRRIAAAVAAAVSLAAVAGIGLMLHEYSGPAGGAATGAPATDTDTVVQSVPADAAESVEQEDAFVVFDNVPLSDILGQIAQGHGVELQINSERSAALRLYFRWERAATLDATVDRLNAFEHIHITLSGNTVTID